jgi:uncharacterized short protein YbdD (DUF466 family)
MKKSEEHPPLAGIGRVCIQRDDAILAAGRAALHRLWDELRSGWRFLRHASGDDAYERYLEHVSRFHPGETPMTRAEHFRTSQEQKWSRVSRCC